MFLIKKSKNETNNSKLNEFRINEITTINFSDLYEQLPNNKVEILKTDVKKFLNNYEKNKIVDLIYIDDNNIYGSYIDDKVENSILKTNGLWKYNIESKNIEYFKYNENNRIWKYIIKNENIYFVAVNENSKNSTYEWKLIKSNLNFENKIILDTGVLYNPMDIPFFRIDSITKKIYFHSTYDELEINSEYELTKYKTKYKISILSNDNLSTIIEETGDYINKTGRFPCNAFSSFDVNNNIITYCSVAFYEKEIIKSFDIKDEKEKIVYENSDLNDWKLSDLKLNETHYLLNFSNKTRSSEEMIISISKLTNEINIIKTNNSNVIDRLNNEDFIMLSESKFTRFSSIKNNFIDKIEVNNINFNYSFFANNNIIVVESNDGEIYIIKIN